MSGSESGTRERPLWISQLLTDHTTRQSYYALQSNANKFLLLLLSSNYHIHSDPNTGYRLVRCRAVSYDIAAHEKG